MPIQIRSDRRSQSGLEKMLWDQDTNRFIISADSRAEAELRLHRLQQNDFRYLECSSNEHPDPVEWVSHVRAQGWSFAEHTEFRIQTDGRMYFHGSVNESSASFRYLVLDQAIAEKLQALVPEIRIRKFFQRGHGEIIRAPQRWVH